MEKDSTGVNRARNGIALVVAIRKRIMPRKPSNHIHRFRKVNIGQNGKDYFVYRCMKPTCTTYIPLHMAEGQMCECTRCNGLMIIDKRVLQGSAARALTNPHCLDCTKSRKKDNAQEIAAITDFLNKTGS